MDLNHDTCGQEARSLIEEGLLSDQKYIPSKFFYDDAGSELFEQITGLDEYYPPKIEAALLGTMARKIECDFRDSDIIELGSGDCSKISIFLEAIAEDIRATIRYIPVDISRGAIEKAANLLAKKFPGLRMHCMPADFLRHLDRIPEERRRVFFFLGGTIGNLSKQEASEFMGSLSCVMNEGDRLILGVDMVKDIDVLERAYNDSRGVTARFNKNILKVVNRHMEGNFDTDDFEHAAYFNRHMERIEMHLRAKADVVFKSPALKEDITVSRGETIHTENSHKFTDAGIRGLAAGAGLKIQNVFTDEKKWFSLVELLK